MSVMATSFLNQIVNEDHESEPAKVITKLNHRIRIALKQDTGTSESADGMDMALCAVNRAANTVHFCGAKRPLLIWRSGEMVEYRGDKQSIGGRADDNTEPYEQNTIDVKSGDRIYLFSDGFTDQFGGEDGKKYSNRRFKEFIESIQSVPVSQQADRFEAELSNWRATTEQTDDILVIGIQI